MKRNRNAAPAEKKNTVTQGFLSRKKVPERRSGWKKALVISLTDYHNQIEKNLISKQVRVIYLNSISKQVKVIHLNFISKQAKVTYLNSTMFIFLWQYKIIT